MDDFPSQPSRGGHSLDVPPHVPGFRVERLLGAGSSAAVWLVLDDRDGTAYALKVMTADPTGSSFDEVGAARELQILQRYGHQHLIRMHGVLPTDQGHALRMDFAAGESLLRLVASRGPLPVGEVVTILNPIAQVLGYLHGEGVTHGDVSPGNILFTAEGMPLLSDLGVSGLLGETTTEFRGTPGFIEPGGGNDPTALNTAADLYALAAVGWFALTGRVPGPSAQRPPLSLLVPGTPDGLMQLIEAGLSEDPSQRPTAQGFAHSVLRVADPAPLDLVSAVHVSVLPELRTRRAARQEARGGAPETGRIRPTKWPTAADRSAARQRRADGAAANQGISGKNGKSADKPHRVAVVLGLLALVLVAGGALFVAPALLDTDARTGAHGMPAASDPSEAVPEAASDAAPDASSEAASDTAPDISSEPSPDQVLSDELQAELADPDPRQALTALSEVRVQAYSSGSTELLELVNVSGSAAMESDRNAVEELSRHGHVFSGLSIQLDELKETTVPVATAANDGQTTAVSGTSLTSGFQEQTSTGSTIRTEPDSTEQQLLFVLQLVEDRWKILAVHESHGN